MEPRRDRDPSNGGFYEQRRSIISGYMQLCGARPGAHFGRAFVLHGIRPPLGRLLWHRMGGAAYGTLRGNRSARRGRPGISVRAGNGVPCGVYEKRKLFTGALRAGQPASKYARALRRAQGRVSYAGCIRRDTGRQTMWIFSFGRRMSRRRRICWKRTVSGRAV